MSSDYDEKGLIRDEVRAAFEAKQKLERFKDNITFNFDNNNPNLKFQSPVTKENDLLEKTYFDYITSKLNGEDFNINDKYMTLKSIRTQREKFVAYVGKRYEVYLKELLLKEMLEEYHNGQQDGKTGLKR